MKRQERRGKRGILQEDESTDEGEAFEGRRIRKIDKDKVIKKTRICVDGVLWKEKGA